MVYVKKGHSTPRQMAYARRVWGGDYKNKMLLALDCGFSPNVARSVSSHIENKPGFNNAMSKLAADSNNLAVSVMHEIKARGFKDYKTTELISALNTIANAWSKFNEPMKKRRDPDTQPNRLKAVVLQQIAINNSNDKKKSEEDPHVVADVEAPESDDLGF